MASTPPDSPSPNAAWEQRFGADGYLYGTEPNDFLREHVGSLPRGHVLCVAEGEGRNAVFLASQGFEVSSIDLTEAGVAKTRRLATQRGVNVDAVTGDLATADLGIQSWNGIVSIFAHLPPTIRRDLHRRVVNALAPGGVFLLEAYTPAQVGRGTGGPPAPELAMTLSGLMRELEGLEFTHALETERDVVEGRGHTGRGSVVQVIARRPV
jgi:SAM-dependent methyltransferase